jgi:hypothetical protein
VIAGGTVLGGRYLIEGERPGDHDEPPSWWAVDRMLKRRVVVVVMPGGAHSLDVARTARLDYAGRLLDGGEHEGEAYLVIRAERSAGPPGVGPAAPPTGRSPDPVGPPPPAGPIGPLRDPTVATPLPGRGEAGPVPPPPLPYGDATRAFTQPISDATAVQPLPTLAGAPLYGQPAPGPPPPAGSPVSNRAVLRMAAMGAVSFVLGAGAVFAVGVLATPEPYVPTGPVSAAEGGDGETPHRTLPSDPVSVPSSPPPTVAVTSTTAAPTTKAGPATKPTRSTRPTTTRRRRGRPASTPDNRVSP